MLPEIGFCHCCNLTILAVDNGDSRSMEPYHAASRHLYRGQASVIVAMTGEPGRIVVYADADGLQTAGAVLIAEK